MPRIAWMHSCCTVFAKKNTFLRHARAREREREKERERKREKLHVSIFVCCLLSFPNDLDQIRRPIQNSNPSNSPRVEKKNRVHRPRARDVPSRRLLAATRSNALSFESLSLSTNRKRERETETLFSPSLGCSKPQSTIARSSSGFKRKSRDPVECMPT